MKPIFFRMFVGGVLLASPLAAQDSDHVHHALHVTLRPEHHALTVVDSLTLPEKLATGTTKLHFLLHAGLQPIAATPGVKLVRESGELRAEQFGIKSNDEKFFAHTFEKRVPLEHYSLRLPAGSRQLVLRYAGKIEHPLQEPGEEYARSFSETPGLIAGEGVFLAAATYWYPWLDADPVTFTLEVQPPPGWRAVSQGERRTQSDDDAKARVRWVSPEPQDEIYLVAAPFTEYSRAAGSVEAMVFLRTPDPELANKYLETTAQYLEMYRKLLGPYPYKKFALVENFWETGYGMPSFTLLGPKVIRFPFILHSSYPHEILHNWWGNSVYVDYAAGNWCEGLTAYLADHLIQEQRGTGEEYRRATLQKYTDYVASGKDFPLTEFRSRHSSVTEAVGYGKTMMFFHMLRHQLGDATFEKALQKFYRDNKFRRAAFADIRKAFSEVTGSDLQPVFAQWVERTGAPQLRVSEATAQVEGQGFHLRAVLAQVQDGPAYVLNVPVAVALTGQEQALQRTVIMSSKRLDISLQLPAPPLRLDVDPQFDLFRRLDRNEIPPALSQAFGAEKALIVLPAAAPAPMLQGYRELAQSWQKSPTGAVEIKLDREVATLPKDAAVWVLGWENTYRPGVVAALTDYDVTVSDTSVRIGKTELLRNAHAVVLSARHPVNPDMALTWVATENVAALPGLGRKLPHYGKYSYLGFEGDEPTNIAKGQWPAVNSPMSVAVSGAAAGQQGAGQSVKLQARQALACLPLVFAEERMRADVDFLAGPDLQGRGFGSAGLEQAADYILTQFREAGLQPAGDADGSYWQSWQDRGGDPVREAMMKNIIGIIPGKKPEFAGQSVVIGAHYDHLGLGWPDAHAGDKGKIHPGADDNASGVAVMLELARILGKDWQPDRTVLFVAFTGEEAGLRGSKYFVANYQRFPAAKCIGMLNLDTVGRLGQQKLTVFGTGSTREWIHIFMGAGFVTGVQIESVAADLGGSDQKSFLDAGVPAVQFFSGPNADYHRPTDTPDKIDTAGMVKVAAVVKEAVEYLASRPEPMTSTLAATPKDATKAPAAREGGRRVSLGTVPDFAYSGKGFRISGVTPGSPAEKAGLQGGDVIVRLNDTTISNIRDFSTALTALQPGEAVNIGYLRDGAEHTASAVVVAR